MMRVVLVEDNLSLRDDIVVSLCAEGLDVIGVACSTDLFFELLQNFKENIKADNHSLRVSAD